MATKAEAAAPGKGGAAEEAVIHRIRITLTSRFKCPIEDRHPMGGFERVWVVLGI